MNQPTSVHNSLPQPPYYAVIFTSQRTDDDDAGYALTAVRMEQLAQEQPGFLGIESTKNSTGYGITVSYWDSLDSIRNWHSNAEHKFAQQLGKEKWYESFQLRVSKVERCYAFP